MNVNSLKKFLKKSRNFTRLRYSALFLKGWFFFRPQVKAMLIEQEQYYNNFFSNLKTGKQTAFDIGANEGFVAESFLKNGLSVIAVEPDQRNITILEARFRGHKAFHLYPCAAGAANEELELYLQGDGTAFSTFSTKWKTLLEKGSYRFHSLYAEKPVKVPAVNIDYLINKHGVPAFIKIDVEGYEAQVLKGLHTRVPLLVFEANLPEFTQETLDCLDSLHRLDPGSVFNYAAVFQLQLEQFVGYTEFRNLLPGISHPCIDVICAMPLYFDYYTKVP